MSNTINIKAFDTIEMWDSEKTYNGSSLVLYNSKLYASYTIPPLGATPDDTNYWHNYTGFENILLKNLTNLPTNMLELLMTGHYPSTTYISNIFSAAGSTYIASANGFIFMKVNASTSVQAKISVVNSEGSELYSTSPNALTSRQADLVLPIQTGYIAKANNIGTGLVDSRFIYSRGSLLWD